MAKLVGDRLWRATKGSAVGGIVSNRRYVVRCAPIVKHYMSTHTTRSLTNLKNAGWSVEEVLDD